MLNTIKGWLHRYLSDSEALVLLLLLVAGFAIILTMGNMLAPVFAALVLAFLMQGVVNWLQGWGIRHSWSVTLVFVLFVSVLVISLLLLVPLVWQQVSALLNELPKMVSHGQAWVRELPEHFPAFVSEAETAAITESINGMIAGLGQWALSFSLANLTNVMALLVYLILVPILVLFFLKDKDLLLEWIGQQLPTRRRVINQVADEMNRQIANYIRGKAIEIVIVGGVSFVLFALMGLNYAVLLATLVGFSVVIPYIGATVVTIPIALIGLFQWGFGQQFTILMIAYLFIQALDGNVLVPLLFSEAVNLHPVAIIIAVLVFGGFWGFWGVFFAIPLATLLKAVMNAWPRVQDVAAKGS